MDRFEMMQEMYKLMERVDTLTRQLGELGSKKDEHDAMCMVWTQMNYAVRKINKNRKVSRGVEWNVESKIVESNFPGREVSQ